MTFNKKSMDAVLKAHKDAAANSRAVSIPKIEEYLEKCNTDLTTVKGIYKKWIITEAMIKGERIFGSIKGTDFINI